jgi:hypothetical protein
MLGLKSVLPNNHDKSFVLCIYCEGAMLGCHGSHGKSCRVPMNTMQCMWLRVPTTSYATMSVAVDTDQLGPVIGLILS